MSNHTDISSIGCIGAGILGTAIMRRLLARGFVVLAWNRTPSKLDALEQAGARVAATPAALTRGCDVVLTCVTDGAAMEQVVFGPQGIASAGTAGQLLIDMSTTDANQTRDMARRLASACGMHWLDAPISGGAPAALEGRMAVMAGGEPDQFERAQPVWDALAGRCTLMGPCGSGQTTKMVNQVLVACGFAVLAEACGLAMRAGVDASRIPEALAGGRADSRLLQEFMGKMAGEDYTMTGSLAVMMKDLEMIHDLSRLAGAPMPVPSITTELYRKLIADGLGERDNSEFVRLYRPCA